MNIVFLIVAATFILFMFIGYKRGLFRSVASTIAIVLAVFLTSAIYPAVNRALCDHTRLDDTIKEMIIEKFDLKVEEVDLPKSVQMEKLDEMNIPESVKELIIENSNKTTYAEAGVNGFFDFAAQYLTNMVMKGIAYVLTFFVIMLFLSIGIALSNIATGIPIVNGINKLGGTLFGMAQAFLAVWIFFVLITMMSAFDWGSFLMKSVESSSLLTWIYEKDIFLKIIVDILKIV